MQEEIYMQTQCSLALLATMAAELDLDGFVAVLDKAESEGPTAAPAAYRRGAEALEHMRALADAARVFVRRTRPVVDALREQGLEVGTGMEPEVTAEELEPEIRRLFADVVAEFPEGTDREGLQEELEALFSAERDAAPGADAGTTT